MMFSFCIPCHGRTHDLKKIMPTLIDAANASPPVEIVILNYNSPDDLEEYISSVMQSEPLIGDSCLTYRKYVGRDYYHMAHARNLSVLASSGEYVIIFSCDLIPRPGFIPTIRRMVSDQDLVWCTTGLKFIGVTVCKKSEFVDAGGYDERFEFYGPEDKDLIGRLRRRGGKCGVYPETLLDMIKTTDEERMKNYRLKLTKQEAAVIAHYAYKRNKHKGVLVVNQGKDWGSWK